MSKQDKLIEAIFDALPATTTAQIAERVSLAVGKPIAESYITTLMTHLRKRRAEYGWTIPHVKKGKPNTDGLDEDRYCAVLVERDGKYEIDKRPNMLMHIHRGNKSTVLQTVTQLQNQTGALRACAEQSRRPTVRAKLNDLADDIAYVARKAAAVAREIGEEDAA